MSTLSAGGEAKDTGFAVGVRVDFRSLCCAALSADRGVAQARARDVMAKPSPRGESRERCSAR